LGPILFISYISPVARVADKFGVGCYQYADDTQLLISFDDSDYISKLSLLKSCSESLYDWFLANGLALNPNKSNAILLGTAARKRTFNVVDHVTIAGERTELSNCVKLLGVHVDSNLVFDQHVNKVCQAAYFHIKALRRIRPVLTAKMANEFACAIISSRLDYCNSLLADVSDCHLNKLQRVQNTLARIVCGASKFDHISPVLSGLHWLPIKSRINYKLAMLTYKTLSAGEPLYLASLIKQYVPSRILRSSTAYMLQIPPATKTRTVFARRAFAFAAPTLWNSLSLELRSYDRTCLPSSFGRKLKTELFRSAYRC